MRRFVFTGESTANTEKTHTPQVPTNSNVINIESLTVSTRGGDIAADVGIYIKDAGNTVWSAFLRSGQVFGAHFSNIGAFPINGAITVVTDDAGSNCIVVTSMVYQTFINDY